MTNAGVLSSVGNAIPLRLSFVSVHWTLLASIAACSVPALGLVGLGMPYAGAVYIVVSLIFALGYRIVTKDPEGFLVIGVGVIPVLIFLRGLFVYNSCLFVLSTGIVLWLIHAPEEVKTVWRDRILKPFILLAVLYWWLSYLNTGEYSNNLRIVELVLSATAVTLLGQRRSFLATALMGVALSTISVGAGMLPNSTDRLGTADLDGYLFGNPVQLGIPSVLVLILSLSDGGQWMFLGRRLWLRIGIALLAGEWLILSGSRGAWIAALGALILLGVFNRHDRKVLLLLAGVIVLVTIAALTTPLGEKVVKLYDKTVDSDRTLANRTSGRSAQWEALPDAVAESPIWGWGPGTGRNVVAFYTGRHLNWHSLYLQIAAETGLLGFTSLVVLVLAISRRAFVQWRTYGEIAPILALLAWLAIGFSVAAYDATCGLFIGVAMLGRETGPRYQIAQVTLRSATYSS